MCGEFSHTLIMTRKNQDIWYIHYLSEIISKRSIFLETKNRKIFYILHKMLWCLVFFFQHKCPCSFHPYKHFWPFGISFCTFYFTHFFLFYFLVFLFYCHSSARHTRTNLNGMKIAFLSFQRNRRCVAKWKYEVWWASLIQRISNYINFCHYVKDHHLSLSPEWASRPRMWPLVIGTICTSFYKTQPDNAWL